MNNGVGLGEIGLEIPRQPLEEFQFVFIEKPIDQFRGEEEIDPVDVIPNKYYYAISKEYHPTTREYTPRLFIIYVTEKTHDKITYKIVYIRVGDGITANIRWKKHSRGVDITKSYRKMLNEFDLYDISLNENNVSPPTFEYSGGRRKTRRSVKRRLRSRRSSSRK